MKNNTKKHYFFYFTLLLVFSCFKVDAAEHAYLKKAVDTFSEKVATSDRLSLTTYLEIGGTKIKEVSLFYSSTQDLALEDARKLMLKVTTSFLDLINNNENIKPDLEPYPFTSSQLDVTIFFRDAKGRYAQHPKIAQISSHKGVITYYKFDQGEFKQFQQEDFKKAAQHQSSFY